MKHEQLCKEKVAQPLQEMGIPIYTAGAMNHKNQAWNPNKNKRHYSNILREIHMNT